MQRWRKSQQKRAAKRLRRGMRAVRVRRVHVPLRVRRSIKVIQAHQARTTALTLLLLCVLLGYFWQRSPIVTYLPDTNVIHPPAPSLSEVEVAPRGLGLEQLIGALSEADIAPTVLNSDLRLNSARFQKHLRTNSRAFIELNWDSLTLSPQIAPCLLEITLTPLAETAAGRFAYRSPLVPPMVDTSPRWRRLRLRQPAPDQQYAEIDLAPGMPRGAYELSLAVVDPVSLEPAIRLNNPSPAGDARYPLGIVYIK